MTQYARPDSDISATNWTGAYTAIDEETPNDSDYITGSDSANGTDEVGLSNVTDPASSADHVIKFRARQSGTPGHQRYLDVSLVQGSTVIASHATVTLDGSTWTDYSKTLSSAEADAITDYTDLRLHITSSGDVGTPAGSRRSVYVSWVVFEVPDASGGSSNAPRAKHHYGMRRN